jgi:hypothetical protein
MPVVDGRLAGMSRRDKPSRAVARLVRAEPGPRLLEFILISALGRWRMGLSSAESCAIARSFHYY